MHRFIAGQRSVFAGHVTPPATTQDSLTRVRKAKCVRNPAPRKRGVGRRRSFALR